MRLLQTLVVLLSLGCLSNGAAAFVVVKSKPLLLLLPTAAQQESWRSSASSAGVMPLAMSSYTGEASSTIDSNLALLHRAAETKQEDSEAVYTALVELEQQMRSACKADDQLAVHMLENLNGDWQLVFTTGTQQTQQRLSGGRINYFPLKAIQSFTTTKQDVITATPTMLIENGIYVGDWPVVKFSGVMDFDLRKRRLEFDFNKVAVFGGLFNIPLKAGEAAELGSKSGLGSDSNVVNAKRGKAAFFNWISADDKIATARGGGGGLALWKRVNNKP